MSLLEPTKEETQALKKQALNKLIEEIEKDIKTKYDELEKSYLNILKIRLYNDVLHEEYLLVGTKEHYLREGDRLKGEIEDLETKLAKLKAHSVT